MVNERVPTAGADDSPMQLIADCEAREDRLSDWERRFIDSLSWQLAAGRGLTDVQSSKLEEVWERVTRDG